MQGRKNALRALGGHLHLANVASSTTIGGGNTGLTNELSPDAWSSHSSPHETGNVNTSAPSQRELHEDDRPQLECSAMIIDDATTGLDLQSDAKAPAMPYSNVAAVAPSAMTTVGVGTVDDTEPCVHNRENEGDGTSEGSKKKKKLVFLGRVELVDLDNYHIPDKRLQCNSKYTDNEEAANREDMDIDIGAPSCVQIVQPSSSTTSA